MPHLDAERLAALDHDVTTADELAHLAACPECRAERAALARLARLAQDDALQLAQSPAPRLTEWAPLSAALRAEGLITRPSLEAPLEEAVARPVSSGHERRLSLRAESAGARATAPARAGERAPVSRPRSQWGRSLRQGAAAAALLAVGVLGGRLSAGMGPARLDAADGRAPLTLATTGVDEFGSLDEATAVLDRAQRDYERASLWLAAHDTTTSAQVVYRARLAALEQMLAASRAGLYAAPQDPVLNQYYLAAYTAREATLRQLGESLPVDRVMESF